MPAVLAIIAAVAVGFLVIGWTLEHEVAPATKTIGSWPIVLGIALVVAAIVIPKLNFSRGG